MLEDLNWHPLEHGRKNKRITTFCKICNNSCTVTLPDYVKTSNSRTRSHDGSNIKIQTNYKQYKNTSSEIETAYLLTLCTQSL